MTIIARAFLTDPAAAPPAAKLRLPHPNTRPASFSSPRATPLRRASPCLPWSHGERNAQEHADRRQSPGSPPGDWRLSACSWALRSPCDHGRHGLARRKGVARGLEKDAGRVLGCGSRSFAAGGAAAGSVKKALADRKSGVLGKSVDLGGRGILKT